MRKLLVALLVLVAAETVEAAPVVKNDATGVSTTLTYNAAKEAWVGGVYTLTSKGSTANPIFELTVDNLETLAGRAGPNPGVIMFGPSTKGIVYTLNLE